MKPAFQILSRYRKDCRVQQCISLSLCLSICLAIYHLSTVQIYNVKQLCKRQKTSRRKHMGVKKKKRFVNLGSFILKNVH